MLKKIPFPKKNEYPEYAEMYMKLLPKDDMILQHLKDNFTQLKEFILSLPQKKLLHRYALNKWTIKEVLVHNIDDERIYAYRAMCFARNDKTQLPGFEQDDYAKYSEANARDINNILEEYEAVRNATITLFNGLSDDALLRVGNANGNNASVRALAYHITGHEMHHFNIIKSLYLE